MAILERGSDLSTFFNTKILEISSPETDHVLLENLSSCTFIQHPLQNFEYNSKPQSQKIPSESIPQSQKFSSKRIPQSQNFQAKNYPKLAHISVSPIVKYPSPRGLQIARVAHREFGLRCRLNLKKILTSPRIHFHLIMF